MKFLLIATAFCCLCITHAKSQLYVQNGAAITTTTGAVVALQNIDLQDNGTINQAAGAGKFLFNGTTNNTISGTGTLQFDNMEIAKTGTGKLSLSRNLNIGSSLLFTSGNIDLVNNNLQLQPTATISGESETSRLMSTGTGTASISTTLNAPNSVNPGNLGATITSSQNMGATIVTRGFTSQTNGQTGAKSILRYYDITPTNNTSLNATLTFNYLDAELNGLDETSLVMLKSDDHTNFTTLGFTIRDPNLDYLALIGIPSFSRWTLSASSNPLPITLVSFNAICENNATFLQWKSATEINAAAYIIQKSANAIDWANINTIAATNNIAGSTYSYKDVSAGAHAYYRLKMVDKDNTFAYSAIFTGGCTAPNTVFSIYPNPAHNSATLTLTAKDNENAIINIYSNDGKLVTQRQWALQKGTNNFILPDIALLPVGSYFVKILLDGNVLQSKLIKQ